MWCEYLTLSNFKDNLGWNVKIEGPSWFTERVIEDSWKNSRNFGKIKRINTEFILIAIKKRPIKNYFGEI